jgi:hypothetical protein
MSEHGRSVGFDGADGSGTLPTRDFRVLAELLKDVETDYRQRNGAPLSIEVRELLRFIVDQPRMATLMRRMRTAAPPEPQTQNGMRTAAPVDGSTTGTLELVTVKQISALAARRGVHLSESYLRKNLEAVDSVGQAKRYRLEDAEAFIAEREVAA